MLDIVMRYIFEIVQIVVALIIACILSLLIKRYFSNLIKKYVVKEHAGKETAFRLLERLAIAFIFFIAIFFSASRIYPGLGAFLSSALLAAGFLAIVVGLAAQRTLGNIFAGFNIILTRPIKIGDAVVLRNEYGTVEDISLRHTIIKTWDNRRMIIPNSVLDEEVIINYTINDPKKLFGITIGVPYDTDLEKVEKIMTDEARNHPNALKELNPIFQVLDFSEGSITLRLLFLAKDQPTAFNTAVDLRKKIKKRFDKAKIKFSMPARYIIDENKFRK